jgi:TPR repeat protein
MKIDLGYSDESNAKRQHAYNLLLAKSYSAAREHFEQIFDGTDTSIAAYLGHLHSVKDSSEYNRNLARAYFKIAASGGDSYAQHALGGILLEDGDEEEAINSYKCASDQGNSECSYVLAGIYMRRGESELAEQFLNRAVDQGHPLAIQNLAVRYMIGRYGPGKIFIGVRMYIKNLRNLAEYAKGHAESHMRR